MNYGTPTQPTRAAFGAIPTRQHVAAAVMLLQVHAPAVWQGEEGPRWRLTVTPGSVQIGTKDYARINRSQEEREARRLRDNPGMTLTVPKRAEISKWSGKSRTNMVRTFCAIDWEPFVKAVELGACPALVTLTLPGDWLAVAPTGEAFKSLVNRLRKRFDRAWGCHMSGPWKLEFQRRGAPHLHILTVPPVGVDSISGLPFAEWLSKTWADVVSSSNEPDRGHEHDPVGGCGCKPGRPADAPCDCSEYCRHLAAGTGVDCEETLRYGDPKRIAVYFSKHGLFADKEYQNVVPEAWSEPGKGPGRFWGVWVLGVVKGNVELADNAHYVKY